MNNSNDIKIVFFDIDGTICTDDLKGEIPESAVYTIKKLRQRGILTYINTGRVVMNIQEKIKALGFDGYVCGCGTYVEINGKKVFHKTAEKGLCLKTLNLLNKCGISALFEGANSLFKTNNNCKNAFFTEFADMFKKQGKNIEIADGSPDFGFDKFCAFYDENSDLKAFKEQIKNDFEFIDRGAGFGEIVPLGISKATGINAVLENLRLEKKNVCSVGDSLNDLPMREASEILIAVGENSRLRKFADFTTDYPQNDGLFKAFLKLGLIDE